MVMSIKHAIKAVRTPVKHIVKQILSFKTNYYFTYNNENHPSSKVFSNQKNRFDVSLIFCPQLVLANIIVETLQVNI